MRSPALLCLIFVTTIASCDARTSAPVDSLVSSPSDFRDVHPSVRVDVALRDLHHPDVSEDGANSDAPKPDLIPHQQRVFAITADIVNLGSPYMPLKNLDFVLALDRAGNALSGHVGVSWAFSPSTAFVQGTYSAGTITIQPFQFSLLSSYCYGPKKLTVTGFSAISDWNSSTITGTFTGKITYQDGDAFGDVPFTATFLGNGDMKPPTVTLTGAALLDAATLHFSEPVSAPPGSSVIVLNTAGTPILTVPFTGYTSRLSLTPAAVWPFGQSLTVVLPAPLLDLALNPLVPPPLLSFSTMSDPGLFTNPGFDQGPSGFASTCVKIISSLGVLNPKQGTGMAYFSSSCLSGQIIARMDLPATASKIVVAVDLVNDAPGPINYPSATLLVAGTTKVSENILQRVGPPVKPVAGATTYPHYHSGFVDIDINVAPLAGQSVALVVGAVLPPVCGYPFYPKHGYLLDDLRIQ